MTVVLEIIMLIVLLAIGAAAVYALRTSVGVVQHEVFAAKWYAVGAGVVLLFCAVAIAILTVY